MSKILYTKEWAAGIIDTFEDFLEEKGVFIPNEERDKTLKQKAFEDGLEYDPYEAAAIYGADYNELMSRLNGIIKELISTARCTDSTVDGYGPLDRPGTCLERISTDISDNKRLVVEKGSDSDYNEIFIGLEDENGAWQQIAVVGPDYDYTDENNIEYKKELRLLVYSDADSENYTHRFIISRHEEEK